MARHNELGTWGEDLAERHLVGEGYIIKERDYCHGKHDIDIIALTKDEREMVFVEVKTRREGDVLGPLAAVTPQKIRSIGICANWYLKQQNRYYAPRFDIITVEKDEEGQPQMAHLEDAFNPCLL